MIPGTERPLQRDLGDYQDVNLNVVVRVLKNCLQKGFLSSSVGSGTSVAYDVATRISVQIPAEEEKPVELEEIVRKLKRWF